MCQSVIQTDIHVFSHHLKPHFLYLVQDKIPNVRILISQTLKLIMSHSTILYFDKDINSAIRDLKKDKSADVRYELEEIHLDDETSEGEHTHNDESGSELHEDKGSEQGEDERAIV